MANVNPPVLLKIPHQLMSDPELRPFFQQIINILNQIWIRSGSGNDDVKKANDNNTIQDETLAAHETSISANSSDIDAAEASLDALQDLEQVSRRLVAQLDALSIRVEDLEAE